jgi:hypothetical protein
VSWSTPTVEITVDCALVGPQVGVQSIPVQPFFQVPLPPRVGQVLLTIFEGSAFTQYTVLADGERRQLKIPGLRMPLQVTPNALVLLSALSGSTGTGYFAAPIPNDPGLRDLVFTLQAFALPALNPPNPALPTRSSCGSVDAPEPARRYDGALVRAPERSPWRPRRTSSRSCTTPPGPAWSARRRAPTIRRSASTACSI